MPTSATELVSQEWAELKQRAAAVASGTRVEGCRFRWKAKGEHLVLGPLAASFTESSDGGFCIVFGGAPGVVGVRVPTQVWEMRGMVGERLAVRWAKNGVAPYRTEEMAHAVVQEVVGMFSAAIMRRDTHVPPVSA
jgi:hypothetical protein